mmetsp:Transcript_80547/g.232806  ORF Transcript_80547/g.232806 Transcript_80547/m.232806 type:complete len:237 (-) Transcript_80547:334-1044(-)
MTCPRSVRSGVRRRLSDAVSPPRIARWLSGRRRRQPRAVRLLRQQRWRRRCKGKWQRWISSSGSKVRTSSGARWRNGSRRGRASRLVLATSLSPPWSASASSGRRPRRPGVAQRKRATGPLRFSRLWPTSKWPRLRCRHLCAWRPWGIGFSERQQSRPSGVRPVTLCVSPSTIRSSGLRFLGSPAPSSRRKATQHPETAVRPKDINCQHPWRRDRCIFWSRARMKSVAKRSYWPST